MAHGFGAALAAVLLVAGVTAPAAPAGARGAAGSGADSWLIVDLDVDALASYDGRLPGLAATSPAVTGARRLDRASPRARRYLEYIDAHQRAFERGLRRAVPGAAVGRRYDTVLGGVSVRVPAGREADVASLPGVRAAFPVERLELLTDSTPALLGADALWDDLGGQGLAGEGVVVGVVDTGVWPEHPSFADPDPAGRAYPAPEGWDGAPCDFGNTAHDPADERFDCNGKLVAAATFLDRYRALHGGIEAGWFDSARDANGHGTHVAATAAGNGGVDAGPLGQVSGIAPRAHLAVYKACGAVGCYSDDTLAAIESAVADGVDVLNYSIAGGTSPYGDPVSQAFLDAYAAGVVVAAAAGNAGPSRGTVNHLQPWTITVGATTGDRAFVTSLTLDAAGDDPLVLEGTSLTGGLVDPAPVALAADHAADPGSATSVAAAERCLEPFPPGTFTDAVVACRTGGGSSYAKGQRVLEAGAAGMVLYEPGADPAAAPPHEHHALPAVRLGGEATAALLDYLEDGGVHASFTDPQPVPVVADAVAPFSGRGGPLLSLGVAKPDVTAPGVGVLAGHTAAPASGPSGQPFRLMQGTSMATPHVTGAAALLRHARPDWSAGAIRSALMLTARSDGVTLPGGGAAGPFDAGSGRIRPALAAAVPLTMEQDPQGYDDLHDRLWEVNHPSVHVPAAADVVALERRFTDATGDGSTWAVDVSGLPGVVADVPATLQVPAGGSAGLPVELDTRGLEPGEVAHGHVLLERDGQRLHLPVTVVRGDVDVELDLSCTPATLPWGATADCAATVTNHGPFDRAAELEVEVPGALEVVDGSVSGGTAESGTGGGVTLRFEGTLPGAPAEVGVAVTPGDGPPDGYAPLADRGAEPLPRLGDEAFHNWTLPDDAPPFVFGGRAFRTFGVVSNGYLVLGGAESADVHWVNRDLPDTERPRDVLAPFWTDLDPRAGGDVYAGVVPGDGGRQWLVVEWAQVPNYADHGERNSFQVWMDLTTPDRAYFTYGQVSGGNGGWLTVGASNATGTSGGAVYFRGPGASTGGGEPPAPTASTGYVVSVTAQPGQPAPPRVLAFQARGASTGPWHAGAALRAGGFAGRLLGGTSGEVVPSVPGTPGSVRAVGGRRAIQVTWSAPGDGGSPITGYRVRATPGGHEQLVGGGERGMTLDGLDDGTAYTVSVRARNAAGLGPAATAGATTDPSPEPAPTPTSTGSPAPGPGDPPGDAPSGTAVEVERIAGTDRFATAAALSAASFSPGVPVAFVATGLDFPDALAGSAVAGLRGGPVLLTLSSRLPDVTKRELERLRPERIHVLGGQAAVGPGVLEALERLAPQVARLSGPDRFATAAEVSRAEFSPGVPVAYVATGHNFPDALAGSSSAAAAGGPVLLVNAREVPAATHQELTRLRPERIVALGGVGVLPAGILAELRAYAPVTRLAGANRFETAAAIALDTFGGEEVPAVFVATGDDYPDALAGSAAAAAAGGPVLLVRRGSVPDETDAALDALAPDHVVVLGGDGAVSEAVVTALRAR